MSKEINELSLELAKNEVNFKRLDGISAVIMDRYELDNAVSLSLVIYSNLIGFGLKESEEESVKLAMELLNGYSTFELKELAISLLGEEVIEHYKKMIMLDYKILAGPMAGMLRNMDKDLKDVLEEFTEASESLEDLLPKIGQ